MDEPIIYTIGGMWLGIGIGQEFNWWGIVVGLFLIAMPTLKKRLDR